MSVETLEKPSEKEAEKEKFNPKIVWEDIKNIDKIDLSQKYREDIIKIDTSKDTKEKDRIRKNILDEVIDKYIKNGQTVSLLIPKKECVVYMTREFTKKYLKDDLMAEVAVGELMANFIEHSKEKNILFNIYYDNDQVEFLIGDPEKTNDFLPEKEKEMPDPLSDRSRGIPMICNKEMMDYANVKIDNAEMNPKEREYYTVHIGKKLSKQ